MTNKEIKSFSLDGFKDGFEAAINRIAEMLAEEQKALFRKDMAEIQKEEIEKAAKIWDATFLQVAKANATK